jgi:flagellar basal body P-ring formation protein FlgA
MIRRSVRTLALALSLTAGFVAGPATAQNAAPALRASVTVVGDIVRIGDLVEHAGVVADVPIFRAPDLSTRGAVPTERVVEAIRPHQLIGIDTHGISEVVVTRASRTITAQEISTRIAKALESQYGLGEARNITVEFDRDARALNVEPNISGDLDVVSLSYNRRTSRFDATIDLPSSTALHWQATHYSGTAVETVEAVTVDHPIAWRDTQSFGFDQIAPAEVRGLGHHRSASGGGTCRPASIAPRPAATRRRPDEAGAGAAQ